MPASAVAVRAQIRHETWAWLAAALLAAVALLPLTKAWTEAPDLGHGWAVPPLLAYLWWERWPQRPAGAKRDRLGTGWWIAAGGLLLAALALRMLLTPFPLWPAALAAYVAVLAGTALAGAWLASGWAGVRWLGGPLIVLAGALPWPTLLELKLVIPMREGLAAAAAEVCGWAGVPVLAAGTTLRLARVWVGVDEACGGMRSLQAGITAALFLGEWLRLAWPRRLGLVAVAVAAAVLGNFLRILLLVWRASIGGDAAVVAAHDGAGWLAMALSLGLVGWAAAHLRRPAAAAPLPGARSPGLGLPRVAVAWIGTIALGLAGVEAGTRGWYWRGEVRRATAVAQWAVRFPGPEAGFRAMPLQPASEEMLHPDFFAAGEWHDATQRLISAYYVEWRKGQAALYLPFLHNPTVCLPVSGCSLVRSLGTLSVPWAGGMIPFQAYVFRRYGEEFVVAFTVWNSSEGKPLANDERDWSSWMRNRLAYVAKARADQPAQMFSVATWGEAAEQRLPGILAALITRK